MTLKTTKEQRDDLLKNVDDPDISFHPWVIKDLCHDADRARELEKEVADLRAKLDEVERKYHELIMAVGTKWPGESRHETALRYIKSAEHVGAAAQKGTGALKEQEKGG